MGEIISTPYFFTEQASCRRKFRPLAGTGTIIHPDIPCWNTQDTLTQQPGEKEQQEVKRQLSALQTLSLVVSVLLVTALESMGRFFAIMSLLKQMPDMEVWLAIGATGSFLSMLVFTYGYIRERHIKKKDPRRFQERGVPQPSHHWWVLGGLAGSIVMFIIYVACSQQEKERSWEKEARLHGPRATNLQFPNCTHHSR